MKFASLLTLVLAGSMAAATPALAADSDPAPVARIAEAHVPDQVIVGFQPGSPAADRASARAQVEASSAEQVSPLSVDTEVWTLPPGRSVESAMAALSRNPNVRFAEPNYILEAVATSNDPDYTNGGLWGMYGDATSPANAFGSQAGEAWAADSTGTSGTYVVVIDEGIQITHPDLASNTWTNPYETAGNGIDDDKNGYVDDINGWDFAGNNNTVYDGTGDDHGTHVSGTIGAVGGNGIGVAGVNWDVTLISAKFLGANGGSTTNAIRAVDYATDLKTRHGLNIGATSNSWGGGGFSQGLLDAIARGGAQDILFVAAAGNSSTNNDTTASYPSNYNCQTGASTFDCVVAVAAIDSNGGLASFSQYGATTVDLGAPGVGIRSTLPSNIYGSYSGTSMATPHVSGAAALCASMNGALRGKALRDALLSSTTATASLSGKTATGGRLDIGKLAPLCGSSTPPVGPAPTVTGVNPQSAPVGASVTISGTDLTGATAVTFNGTAATAFTVASASQITATVPAGATTGAITVTTPGGTATGPTFTVEAAPSAPTALGTVSVTRTSGTVRWSAPTSGPVTGYEIRLGTAGTWVPLSSSTTQYTFSSLVRNTNYTWQVRALNSIGPGPAAQASFRTAR